MNTLDPRVDSDRDGSKAMGNNNRAQGTTGYGAAEGTHGPKAADPRVDSDRNRIGIMNPDRGTGPAPHTAGPHKSDLMNKLDPRVDSDLDGSKTVGGNKTFS
jgi:hypothetical protein